MSGLIQAILVPVRRSWSGDGRLARVLLAGLLVLPLASRPLAVWAGNLPDWLQPVRDGANWWDAEMARAGLTAPYDILHHSMRDLVARSF